MRIGNADYKTDKTPKGYVCGKCGKSGIKLWRESHTLLDNLTLICAPCLAPTVLVSPEGRYEHPDFGRSDQLAGRLPAVPCESGSTFWGYTSVPYPGVAWWQRLPLVPGGPKGTPDPDEPPPLPPRLPSPQIEDADYLVEATHNEEFEFWRRFASHWRAIPGDTIAAGDPKRRCKWEEINVGHCVTVGTLRTKRRRAALTKERPVVITVFFARIEGFLVGFWSPSSQLVDYEMIREFLDNLDKPGCDAANFYPQRVVEACQNKEKCNA